MLLVENQKQTQANHETFSYEKPKKLKPTRAVQRDLPNLSFYEKFHNLYTLPLLTHYSPEIM